MYHSLRQFIQGLRRPSASGRQTQRPRPLPRRLVLENLEDRLVPSTSSAISIQQDSGTERDWFTVDRTSNQVVEFQGTTRYDLAGPTGVVAVSASYNPINGHGEVFALAFDPVSGQQHLWSDTNAGWTPLGGDYSQISATRDGHVYALDQLGQGIFYLDESGTIKPLGAPAGGLNPYGESIAASVSGWFGNEVFAIGRNDGAIYVYRENAPFSYLDGWKRVDHSAYFLSLSATQNDTVFATDNVLHLHQVTGFYVLLPYPYLPISYYTSQDISGGMRWWGGISADLDASGRDELYAIEAGTSNAYLYNQGTWTYKAYDAYEIAGADGGYFYEVYAYWDGEFPSYYQAYQYDPNAGFWTYLDSDVH
jgi:hypothetical protein